MRSIEEKINLNDKRILLRLDLNVPLDKGRIIDSTRIDKILPTLRFLIKQNSKIIILSHVGRPNGKVVNELSLKPICEDLGRKLNQNVKLITKNINEIDNKDLFKNNEEKLVMLENIRFYFEEEKNCTGKQTYKRGEIADFRSFIDELYQFEVNLDIFRMSKDQIISKLSKPFKERVEKNQ